MAVFTGFRNTSPPSPFRVLYGRRDGSLLFPMDLAFTSFGPDAVDATGAFLGATVSGSGFDFGTIADYTWPPLGAVSPVVTVTPDPGFPLVSAVALPSLTLPVVPNKTRVSVDLDGSTVEGTIVAFDNSVSYIDPAHHIAAYVVQFDAPVLPDFHGSPVTMVADGTIVGMLISTQPISGAPNAFVCRV